MQEHSLKSPNPRKTDSIEGEIAKEKASALGLAGTRLQQSLERYAAAQRTGRGLCDAERLLSEVAWSAWALIVQREAMGLGCDNAKWVAATFGVPKAALARMGEDPRLSARPGAP